MLEFKAFIEHPTIAWPLYQVKTFLISALLPVNKNADTSPLVFFYKSYEIKQKSVVFLKCWHAEAHKFHSL